MDGGSSEGSAGYTQDANKIIKIKTILDDDSDEKDPSYPPGDPVVLAKLDGTEGVSKLYSYDISLLRDARRPPLRLENLIDTKVLLGVRYQSDDKDAPAPPKDDPFIYRVGIFESMTEPMDINKVWLGSHGAKRNLVRQFRVYRAHVVPAISLLSRDVRYRIFENKTVLDIVKALIADLKAAKPPLSDIQIVTSYIDNIKFPTMPYCVQYGESTLDFLFRLLARFGIWYYFGYQSTSEWVLNQSMVLQPSTGYRIPGAWNSGVKLDDDAEEDSIANLVQRLRPPQRKMTVGAFNQLVPNAPFWASGTVQHDFDMLKGEESVSAQTRWFETTTFAEPVINTTQAETLAQAQSCENQADIKTMSGNSKNATLMPGYYFRVEPESEDDIDDYSEILSDKYFVIDSLSFSGQEYSYLNLPGWQLLDIFFNTYSTLDSDSQSAADVTEAKVSAWVSNCAQNWAPPVWPTTKWPSVFGSQAPPGVLTPKSGPLPALLNPLWGLMWLCIQNISLGRMVHDAKDLSAFSCSFFSMPMGSETFFALPQAARPVARGPQTAVVIGLDGVSTAKGDIYADAIGRVRIRFPWDPGPPVAPSQLPGPFPYNDPQKPYKSGENTCWARVVEGWGGRGFGTQFLPRVGQEVLVDFLDGDPEQPVISGRLYNADHGPSNLPFPGDQKTTFKDVSELPATAKYYKPPFAGIKTRSTPKPDNGAEGYHLLRFDDTYDCEQLLLRSQARLDVTAFAHSFETTYGNKHNTAVPGTDSKGNKFGGNMYTTVGGEYDLHIGACRYEQVDKDYELTVKGDVRADLKGDLTAVVKGNVSIAVNALTIEATEKITLKVGSSFIVIDHCAVYISGPSMVYINSGGSPDKAASVTMQNVADATLAEPGDKWNTRTTPCEHTPGGGGGRGTHTENPTPAPDCDAVVGGVSCGFLPDAGGGP
jgi:uncharacterized protein involved in type VI secretion and phage assembly